MKTQVYVEAIQRLKDIEHRQSMRLREEVLVKYFSGNECCRHNWMLNYEEGRGGLTPEAYKAGRYYVWKQRKIWDDYNRLYNHFCWKAYYPERSENPFNA